MTGRSEALSCLGNQTSQGFVDLKLLREAAWTPEGVRHDRRQKAMASLFLWPRKTAQQPKQPVQAWRNTCATSEKRNPHTPHAGRNRFSSQKISMSSHFIMHPFSQGNARHALSLGAVSQTTCCPWVNHGGWGAGRDRGLQRDRKSVV